MKIPDTDENPKAPAPKEMIDLEATFEKIESELKEVNTNAEALRRNYLELTELKEVLKKTHVFFSEVSWCIIKPSIWWVCSISSEFCRWRQMTHTM